MDKVLTIDGIVARVKVKIDEIAPNDAEFLQEQDNVEMYTIIRESILEGLRFVCSNADPSMIDPDSVMTGENCPEGMLVDSNLVGHLTLPDNFLRLVYARFSSWVTYVTEPVYWNQENEYAMLHNPYTTGTWERPKVAIVKTPKPGLELYSAKSLEDGWSVGIVSDRSIFTGDDGEECVGVPEKLTDALVYYVAGLTLLTYKDSHADSMFNQALVLAGINVKQ